MISRAEEVAAGLAMLIAAFVSPAVDAQDDGARPRPPPADSGAAAVPQAARPPPVVEAAQPPDVAGTPAGGGVSPPERLPAPRPRSSPRAERFVAWAFTSGVLLLPPWTWVPVPEVGFNLGFNLGPYLMLDLGAGIAQIAGGGKLLLGTRELVPYVVARFGATAWTGWFVLAGLGLDLTREDGTYAFIEAGPMLARNRPNEDDLSDNPPAHWRTVTGSATFGFGKRY